MKKLIQNRRVNAFTLIELMVVLVVIAILTAITIPVSKYASQRAKDAQFEVQMSKIKNALEDYRAKYGEYPITPYYETYTQSGNDITTNSQKQSPEAVRQHYPSNYPTFCYEAYQITNTAPTLYTNMAFFNTSSNEWTTIEPIESIFVDYALTYPLIIKPLANGETPYLGDGEDTLLTVLSLITYTAPKVDDYLTFYTRTRDGKSRRLRGKRRYGWPINRHYLVDPRNGRQIKYTSDGLNYSITNY